MDYYIDHLAYPAYAAIPAGTGWPLPAQDGDGLATGLASAAVAAIDCAGVTAAAGHTLSIAGAALTCVASGANGTQFNGGAGATLAANLAAAINASTVLVAAGASPSLPQLRSLVYARVQPGTSTTVQLMTRAGAAAFNHAANSAMAVSATGFAPALTQFSGGASGAWGYLWNDTVLWPQALSAGAYGAVKANLSSGAGLLASPPAPMTENDWVWLRAKDEVLTYGVTRTIAIAAPFQLVVDCTNAKWPGTLGKKFTFGRDAGPNGGLIQLVVTAASVSTPMFFALTATAPNGVVLTNGCMQPNVASTSHALISIGTALSGRAVFENVLFDSPTPYAYRCGVSLENQWGGAKAVYFRNIQANWARSAGLTYFLSSGNAGTLNVHIDGLRAVLDAATSHPGMVRWQPASVLQQVVAKNCTAASPGGSVKITEPFSNARNQSLRTENMEGFDLVGSGLFGLEPGGLDASSSVQVAVGPNKRTQVETCATLLEWLPGSGFPTLQAELEDGTLWSWRLTWSSSGAIYAGAPVDQLTLTQRAPLTTAVRTVTIEALVASDIGPVPGDALAMLIAYTDSAGILRSESTAPMGSFRTVAPALPASAASWALGSYGTHTPVKLTKTTAWQVKAGTDIMATLQFLRPSPAVPSMVFVEPDLRVM